MNTPATYIVLDTETTGLFDFKKPADADGQPRCASMALVLLTADLDIAEEHHWLIKPDGWSMSAETAKEAAKINGLTDERLHAEGVPIADALARYTDALEHVIVGYGVDFDLKMMRGELRRAGLPDHFEKTRSIDCMRPLTDVCKIPKATGRGYKWPKLVEAYTFLFDRTFEGAHGALADAKAAAEIFREMHLRGIAPPARMQAKD